MTSSVYHFEYNVEDVPPWSSNRFVSAPGKHVETYIDLSKIITITPMRNAQDHVLTIEIKVVGQEKAIYFCEHEFAMLPVGGENKAIKFESSFVSNYKRLLDAWSKWNERR